MKKLFISLFLCVALAGALFVPVNAASSDDVANSISGSWSLYQSGNTTYVSGPNSVYNSWFKLMLQNVGQLGYTFKGLLGNWTIQGDSSSLPNAKMTWFGRVLKNQSDILNRLSSGNSESFYSAMMGWDNNNSGFSIMSALGYYLNGEFVPYLSELQDKLISINGQLDSIDSRLSNLETAVSQVNLTASSINDNVYNGFSNVLLGLNDIFNTLDAFKQSAHEDAVNHTMLLTRIRQLIDGVGVDGVGQDGVGLLPETIGIHENTIDLVDYLRDEDFILMNRSNLLSNNLVRYSPGNTYEVTDTLFTFTQDYLVSGEPYNSNYISLGSAGQLFYGKYNYPLSNNGTSIYKFPAGEYYILNACVMVQYDNGQTGFFSTFFNANNPFAYVDKYSKIRTTRSFTIIDWGPFYMRNHQYSSGDTISFGFYGPVQVKGIGGLLSFVGDNISQLTYVLADSVDLAAKERNSAVKAEALGSFVTGEDSNTSLGSGGVKNIASFGDSVGNMFSTGASAGDIGTAMNQAFSDEGGLAWFTQATANDLDNVPMMMSLDDDPIVTHYLQDNKDYVTDFFSGRRNN